MKQQIISCYKSKDNRVVAISRDNYFVYPYRLKNNVCDKLVRLVIEAGAIESSKWEIGEQL